MSHFPCGPQGGEKLSPLNLTCMIAVNIEDKIRIQTTKFKPILPVGGIYQRLNPFTVSFY